MKLRQFYVYLITNSYNKVLYIGVTNNLQRRILEHKSGNVRGFSYQYNLNKLIYFDICDTAEQAIAREKQLKKIGITIGSLTWLGNKILTYMICSTSYKWLTKGDPEASSG